ncbi:MAG TPA: hypothetical protein VJV04_01510, partial [Nitrospiraceae bacterium]|nr:hypothetical protein [Nitrospiraceae bacterium]
MQDVSELFESLHPLEIKVLTVLGAHQVQSQSPLREEPLTRTTGLEPSQISMAIGWLLAKSLIRVEQELVHTSVSLTDVGEHYFEKYAPIERILSVLKQGQQTEKRLTIQDIQRSEGLEPTEMSSAIGTLKKEGAVRIVPGGFVEATGAVSRTAESLRTLLQQLHGGTRDLSTFTEPMRDVIKQHAVKRGNAREPFRLDDRPDRAYVLTPEGEAIQSLLKDGVAEEVSQLTPELLKDGSWRTKRFSKYSISLRPPRTAVGKRHPYREFLDQVKYKLVGMGFQEMR